jgi:futalosine hydrolase
MRILIVAATDMEFASLTRSLRTAEDIPLKTGVRGRHTIDALATGVGMVATAAWCSRALARQRYDLALNIGICGSFDPVVAPGSVAHVVTDRLSELGAEDGEAFLTARELNLVGEDEPPFVGGCLVNQTPPVNAALMKLPRVHGITVNTVHGHEASIARVRDRFSPQVESMEGAAFMYSCLIAAVPFAQVRAVSNFVERRNRKSWDIARAVTVLERTAMDILDHV